MAILLIRHGETDSNAARIVQTPDIPLSARGIAQAERLAQRLAGLGVSRILSSDLTRAVMTAERLRAATGAPIAFDAGLQERNFGDVRGRAYAELGVDILAPDYEPPGRRALGGVPRPRRRRLAAHRRRRRGGARQPRRRHPRPGLPLARPAPAASAGRRRRAAALGTTPR